MSGSPNSSRGDLAQQRLEFAVRQLDRVEIGRVPWQVAKAHPRFLDRLPDARDLVGWEVVYDNNVMLISRRVGVTIASSWD